MGIPLRLATLAEDLSFRGIFDPPVAEFHLSAVRLLFLASEDAAKLRFHAWKVAHRRSVFRVYRWNRWAGFLAHRNQNRQRCVPLAQTALEVLSYRTRLPSSCIFRVYGALPPRVPMAHVAMHAQFAEQTP